MLSALRQLETRTEGFTSPITPDPVAEEESPVAISVEPPSSATAPEASRAAEVSASHHDDDTEQQEAPLWMATERITEVDPPMPSDLAPSNVVQEAPPDSPPPTPPSPLPPETANPAFDGLAALLSQPLPDRPREATQREKPKTPIPPPDELQNQIRPASEDRALSLAPMEARLKRNAVQDPLAGQMRIFSRKVIQQFSGIQPATVLFVGADVGDHTSIVAAQLGALLAEQNQGGVLLIDADVARRTLSAGYGRDNHRGLAELLGDSLGDGQSPIHATMTSELSILPCGRGAFPAATHLETRIPLLLSGLSERWPWIVVQGGAADSALTGSFAGACQGSYVVVRLGQTAPSEAAEALAILNAAGACILGCVATNAP
jgi:Mrp family chromosome partitioning ATPase